MLGEEVKLGENIRDEIDYVDESMKDNPPTSDPVAVAADPVARADSDNDDTMSYFAKLAAEA